MSNNYGNSNNVYNTSVESPLEHVNPFKKGGLIPRTPENPKEDLEEDQCKRSEPLDTLSKLGDLISFIKTKNNVHHSIKEQVRRIKVTYNEAVNEIRGNNKDLTKKRRKLLRRLKMYLTKEVWISLKNVWRFFIKEKKETIIKY